MSTLSKDRMDRSRSLKTSIILLSLVVVALAIVSSPFSSSRLFSKLASTIRISGFKSSWMKKTMSTRTPVYYFSHGGVSKSAKHLKFPQCQSAKASTNRASSISSPAENWKGNHAEGETESRGGLLCALDGYGAKHPSQSRREHRSHL